MLRMLAMMRVIGLDDLSQQVRTEYPAVSYPVDGIGNSFAVIINTAPTGLPEKA